MKNKEPIIFKKDDRVYLYEESSSRNKETIPTKEEGPNKRFTNVTLNMWFL